MNPQPRDQSLIRTIYEHQSLEIAQAHRFFFKQAGDHVTQRRIRILERAGLLRRQHVYAPHKRTLLRLTQSGIALAEIGRSNLIKQPRTLDVRLIPHNLAVATVRLRLAELWDAHWVPEALLKTEEFEEIPDGVAVFSNGHRVAVEVENSIKGADRFQSLLERWKRIPVTLVLYVSTTPQIASKLRDRLAKGPEEVPFGLVELAALEQSDPPAVWTPRGEFRLLHRRVL